MVKCANYGRKGNSKQVNDLAISTRFVESAFRKHDAKIECNNPSAKDEATMHARAYDETIADRKQKCITT